MFLNQLYASLCIHYIIKEFLREGGRGLRFLSRPAKNLQSKHPLNEDDFQ